MHLGKLISKTEARNIHLRARLLNESSVRKMIFYTITWSYFAKCILFIHSYSHTVLVLRLYFTAQLRRVKVLLIIFRLESLIKSKIHFDALVSIWLWSVCPLMLVPWAKWVKISEKLTLQTKVLTKLRSADDSRSKQPPNELNQNV